MRTRRRAMTLTEVIIGSAMVFTLAAFIWAEYSQNLWPRHRRTTRAELRLLGGAIHDLSNEFGAFPPNLMASSVDQNSERSNRLPMVDLIRMFRRSFPRSKEPEGLLFSLAGETDEAANAPQLAEGLMASEAVFFWLGGFSQDPYYPISGPGGPSFSDSGGNSDGVLDARDERLRSRRMRFEFDVRRLGPQTKERLFDEHGESGEIGRYIEYDDPRDGSRRRINLWRYYPARSNVAIAYFDVSRHAPSEYYPAIHSESGSNVGPLMQLREGSRSESTARENLRFVEEGKFQLLHAGADNVWGDWSAIRSGEIIVPQGPFLGDIADTLANFMSGTLEDKQE